MADDLLARAADLQRRGQPFALATVVRCEHPTSAKPGAKALVFEDGSVAGWVGGACAEPVVVREALAALRDGRPRLIGLLGDGTRGPGRTEGIVEFPMTCHSGGTLEVYVEPYLPKRQLVLVGHGPVVESLATLGRAADYAIVSVGAADVERIARLDLTSRASVVVATHGDVDEDALSHVLATAASYVSLVASRRRAAVIAERLRTRGVAPERLGLVQAPAGLDLGAVTPEEIAVSILAEIIQHHRSPKAEPVEPASTPPATTAIDPICGMTVEVAIAPHRSEAGGETVYFCCRGCKDTFDARR
jgi:xanthine dehydrogenase accessory factor